MYVNIGAWVGEQSLIDSHALVGSCAQVGARVHVSAGAQIGGVIEPVGALPVIIEDEALIGGNTGIYEGAIIKARAVVAAGTVLTGSTPVYDLVRGEIIQPDRRSSARHSRRRRRRARRARGHGGQGPGVGPVAGDAGHRQVPRLADRHAHGARGVDPVVAIDGRRSRRADARARRHRFDNRARRRSRAVAGGLPARAGYRRHRTAGRRRPVQRHRHGRAPRRRSCFSTHFDCVPPFFPSRVEGDRLYGRGACDAKGILAAQVAAAERLRRAGETRVGLLFVVGEERGSDGARVRERRGRAACRFLIDGEPTDNRLGLATRGMLRLKLRAAGRAAHSSFPELGESAIDKLIDALSRCGRSSCRAIRSSAGRTTPSG